MRFVAPLTVERQDELEKLHRGGCSHRVRQRAHAVLLNAQGYTLDQSADVLRVDRDALSRWLDRWERGGLAALSDAPKSGRPPKVEAAMEAEVAAAAASASPASVERTLAKRGRCGSPAGTHAKEEFAQAGPALAAQPPAHGQSADAPPGGRRAQGVGQAARP